MAVSVQITQPEPFNFSRPSDWPRWIRRFDRFHVASAICNQDEEYQINALLYAMGDAADDIFCILPMPEADRKKYASVKTAMEQHFIGKHNVSFERAQFNMRCQQEGSSEAFITEVHKLAEDCRFGMLKEELIRD